MKYENQIERGSYVVYLTLDFSGNPNFHINFYRYNFNKFGGSNGERSYLVENITPSSLQRIFKAISTISSEKIDVRDKCVTYDFPCDMYNKKITKAEVA